MAITKSTRVVSRAGKAKNRKWDVKERFSVGHDSASRSLISDDLRVQKKGNGIRVVRAETFWMSREDRIAHDAQRLLDLGRAETAEEAIDAAIAALEAPATRGNELNEVADYLPWRKVKK